MKKITLVVLSVLICGATQVAMAAKHHKHKKKHDASGNITSVSIHRTACFGRCPDYTIEIKNDGSAIYTAVRFNPDTGIYTKNIGAEKVMEIFKQFETYRVDTCKDMYPNRIPDIPGLIITIQYTDSLKTIRDAHFGPYFLKQLATSIDQVAKKTDDTWQKTGMPKVE